MVVIPYSRQEILKKSGIYVIKNNINNKVYVGSTNNLYSRFNMHKNDIIKSRHHSCHLQRFYNKHNAVLTIEVIEFCEPEERIDKENYYIGYFKSYSDGYNCCPKAESPNQYRPISEETRKKLSESHKKLAIKNRDILLAGLKKGKETIREKIENGTWKSSWIGKKHKESTKLKISEYVKNNPVKLTDEQRLLKNEKIKLSKQGSKSHYAKLNEDSVKSIRRMIELGIGHLQISIMFNVSRVTISDIKRRKSWKHI